MVASERKPTKSTTIKKARFIKLFPKKAENISETCKSLKIDRKTYYKWIAKDKKFAKKIEELKEAGIDYAESQLKKLMTGIVLPETKVFNHFGKIIECEVERHFAPCKTSIIFFLKTKGKKRGYIEHVEEEKKADTNEKIQDLIDTLEKVETK